MAELRARLAYREFTNDEIRFRQDCRPHHPDPLLVMRAATAHPHLFDKIRTVMEEVVVAGVPLGVAQQFVSDLIELREVRADRDSRP